MSIIIPVPVHVSPWPPGLTPPQTPSIYISHFATIQSKWAIRTYTHIEAHTAAHTATHTHTHTYIKSTRTTLLFSWISWEPLDLYLTWPLMHTEAWTEVLNGLNGSHWVCLFKPDECWVCVAIIMNPFFFFPVNTSLFPLGVNFLLGGCFSPQLGQQVFH